jgi:hypothetical protein
MARDAPSLFLLKTQDLQGAAISAGVVEATRCGRSNAASDVYGGTAPWRYD